MSGHELAAAGNAEPAAVIPFPLLDEQTCRLIDRQRFGVDGLPRPAPVVLVQLRARGDRRTSLGQVEAYLAILAAADTAHPPR